MKVYIVNGPPGCGKTTFSNMAIDISTEYYKNELKGYPVALNLSTVDSVKLKARQIGWDGNKDDKGRALLSGLKQLLLNYDDSPFLDVANRIKTHNRKIENYFHLSDTSFYFVMSREAKEIDRFKEELGAKAIYIQNSEAETRPTSNSSDRDVLNYEYDIYIDNNGSLEDLKNNVILFLKEENLLSEKKGK